MVNIAETGCFWCVVWSEVRAEVLELSEQRKGIFLLCYVRATPHRDVWLLFGIGSFN